MAYIVETAGKQCALLEETSSLSFSPLPLPYECLYSEKMGIKMHTIFCASFLFLTNPNGFQRRENNLKEAGLIPSPTRFLIPFQALPGWI